MRMTHFICTCTIQARVGTLQEANFFLQFAKKEEAWR